MVTLYVDDIEVSVPKNTTVLQACDTIGIEVPRFCFHERLLIAGNCRMCLVEIEKSPKPVPSCAFPVMDNMKVYTKTPLVKKAQEAVLEFLLINHPLDCPICDQGGECDLQDQAMNFGSDSSRFYHLKRGVEDKNTGPLVKTIMTRCIHCTRCIRFATEIAGVPDLGTTGRGKKTEIGTYVKKLLTSEVSGNIIDLCPVGALTSKPYAFTARSWEMENVETIDVMDSIGSNIQASTKGNKVMRVLPRINEEINEEWISNKTRFSYDGLSKQRLMSPMVKNASTGLFEEITWKSSFQLLEKKLKGISGKDLGAIIGGFTDINASLGLKSFLNSLGSSNIALENIKNNEVLFDENFNFNTTLADISKADVCLVVDLNPRYDLTVLNLHLRKKVIQNDLNIGYIGSSMDLTYNATHLGTSLSDYLKILKGNSPFCKVLKNAKNPIIIHPTETNVSFVNAMKLLNNNIKLLDIDWSSFNKVQKNISVPGALNIGLSTPMAKVLHSKILFICGADNLILTDSQEFVVYIGHHGDKMALNADLLLPSSAFTEENGFLLNMEKRLQKSNRINFCPGNSRETSKIFKALSLFFENPNNIDNVSEHLLFPNQKITDQVVHKKNFNFMNNIGYTRKNKIVNTEKFISNEENHYKDNSISRASSIMAECSKIQLKLNFR
jgi:NADH dehydrogenase (ubiquinone) Fe-S protein 1